MATGIDDGISSKDLFKKWLEKLQQESWQLELLISGFALYGIYASHGMVIELDFYSDKVDNPFVDYFHQLLSVGWKIFFVNLLIHVILRSLWIGAIGLRYVSGEINYDDLNYSKYFTEYLERKVGDYDDFIERLERICSVIFSYTFLLFLLFLSTLLYFFLSTLPIFLVEKLGFEIQESFLFMLYITAYFGLGFLVFVDFITLGGFKRINDTLISKIYFPIYWFFSTITLSFLYRPLIYNFIDDKYTRKLFFLSIPYVIVIAFGNRFFTHNDHPHIPEFNMLSDYSLAIDPIFYDDLDAEQVATASRKSFGDIAPLPTVRLESYEIVNDYSHFFIKAKTRDENFITKKLGIDPYYEPGWNFSLFRFGKKKSEDIELDRIKATDDDHKGEIRKLLSALRKQKRKAKGGDRVILESKIDSLVSERQKIRDRINQNIEDYKFTRSQELLQAYKSLFTFKIDGVNYSDSLNCFFSAHPHYGEMGLRCNYNTRGLSQGNHILEFERLNYSRSYPDSISRSTYKLPVIKMSN